MLNLLICLMIMLDQQISYQGLLADCEMKYHQRRSFTYYKIA